MGRVIEIWNGRKISRWYWHVPRNSACCQCPIDRTMMGYGSCLRCCHGPRNSAWCQKPHGQMTMKCGAWQRSSKAKKLESSLDQPASSKEELFDRAWNSDDWGGEQRIDWFDYSAMRMSTKFWCSAAPRRNFSSFWWFVCLSKPGHTLDWRVAETRDII